MQYSFSKLLRKNLLYMAFPVVLVLSVLLLLLQQVSRLEIFQTGTMEDTTRVKEYFASGQRNVSVMLPGLKSTGFSQMANEKEKAEYFYRMEGNEMQLVLLTKSTANAYRRGEYDRKAIRVRIIRDEVAARHIEREYANSLGLTGDSMDGICSVYVFDETEYPLMRVRILRYSSIVIAVLLILIMLYVILATAFPALNHEARVLRRFGNVGRIIRRIDREMERKLRYHQDNVTVTENYLIVSYISHIDVIQIDDIKYLSKHVEKRKRGLGRPVHVYRLTASNADDLFFEADFFDEETVNDVIYFMRGEPLLEYEEYVQKEREEEENVLAEQMSENEKEAVTEEDQQKLDGLFEQEEPAEKPTEESTEEPAEEPTENAR
ncbi:MAG: hypothetical protein IJM25_12895 [Eubacterium sp.]|nr:hypothetical protein [Eubacterium sp.]